jgi:dethiobiotin synthetase
MSGVFVTATDTGAGKTRTRCALVRALREAGVRAAGMKPVAAGIDQGAACNEDVAALARADGLEIPRHVRNPYAFAAPIAPHVAARDEGVAIDLEVIAAAFASLAGVANAVVVEGAGGALVPLGPRFDMLDIPRRLSLPVVMVVGVRLGCLNHARLTAQAIAARGLPLAGWVANRIDPRMLRANDNVDELARLIAAPMIADVGFDAAPAFDRAALSRLGVGIAERTC